MLPCYEGSAWLTLGMYHALLALQLVKSLAEFSQSQAKTKVAHFYILCWFYREEIKMCSSTGCDPKHAFLSLAIVLSGYSVLIFHPQGCSSQPGTALPKTALFLLLSFVGPTQRKYSCEVALDVVQSWFLWLLK
jgi:hypothetical protein